MYGASNPSATGNHGFTELCKALHRLILLVHERVIQAIYPVVDASKLASLTILLFIVVADMLVLVDALSMHPAPVCLVVST